MASADVIGLANSWCRFRHKRLGLDPAQDHTEPPAVELVAQGLRGGKARSRARPPTRGRVGAALAQTAALSRSGPGREPAQPPNQFGNRQLPVACNLHQRPRQAVERLIVKQRARPPNQLRSLHVMPKACARGNAGVARAPKFGPERREIALGGSTTPRRQSTRVRGVLEARSQPY